MNECEYIHLRAGVGRATCWLTVNTRAGRQIHAGKTVGSSLTGQVASATCAAEWLLRNSHDLMPRASGFGCSLPLGMRLCGIANDWVTSGSLLVLVFSEYAWHVLLCIFWEDFAWIG